MNYLTQLRNKARQIVDDGGSEMTLPIDAKTLLLLMNIGDKAVYQDSPEISSAVTELLGHVQRVTLPTKDPIFLGGCI